MFCEKCGYQLADDSDFCPSCGAPNPRKGNTGTIRDVLNQNPPQPGYTPAPGMPTPQPSMGGNAPDPGDKKRKGLIIALIAVAAAAVAVVVIALVLLLPKKKDNTVTTASGGSSSTYVDEVGINPGADTGGVNDLPDITTIDLQKPDETPPEDPDEEEYDEEEENEKTREHDLDNNWNHDEFLGLWDDRVSQRCHMEISYGRKPGEYRIDINWGDSASTTYHWVYYGMYDFDVYALYIEGTRYIEVNGDSTKELEDLYGYIGFTDTDTLIWMDYVDGSGSDCLFVQQRDDDYSYYILPESNYRYYSRDELLSLTKDQLRIARNEIMARHGRMFKDEELQAYFNAMPWYYPLYTPDEFDAMIDSILNEYEKANVELIKSLE